MTAYPDENVRQSVLDDLYAFNDASAWIKKPVKFDELSAQIEKYLVLKRRTGRRFTTKMPMKLVAKAEGRGKRAPKASGTLLNLSIGGACVQVESGVKMKKKQELTLTLTLPNGVVEEGVKAKRNAKAAPGVETKIKATVAWIAKGEVGLQFAKLSDTQMQEIEAFLKVEARVSAA
jgi:c-di-GMP-binding flagellar brake protein YcgR